MASLKKAYQPNFMRLEGREQPGSLLSTGLDVGLVAGAVLGEALEASRPTLVRSEAQSQKLQVDDGGMVPLSKPLSVQQGAVKVAETTSLSDIGGIGAAGRLTASTLTEYLGITPEELQKGLTWNAADAGEGYDTRGPNLMNYNGDFDGRNGLANEFNTIVSDARIYDGFRIRGAVNKDCYISHNLMNFTGVTSAFLHVVGPGSPIANYGIPNGGLPDAFPRTQLTNGVGGITVTQTPTGLSGFGFTDYEIKVCGLNMVLPQNHYWVGVQPVGAGSGRAFNSTASYTQVSGSGANGTVNTPRGGPGANDNGVFDSTFFGVTWGDPDVQLGAGTWDFSIAVCSAPAC